MFNKETLHRRGGIELRRGGLALRRGGIELRRGGIELRRGGIELMRGGIEVSHFLLSWLKLYPIILKLILKCLWGVSTTWKC